eukprot:12193696-Prorocentrum_lima.AAC.1
MKPCTHNQRGEFHGRCMDAAAIWSADVSPAPRGTASCAVPAWLVQRPKAVSYTHLRAHETRRHL